MRKHDSTVVEGARDNTKDLRLIGLNQLQFVIFTELQNAIFSSGNGKDLALERGDTLFLQVGIIKSSSPSNFVDVLHICRNRTHNNKYNEKNEKFG